MAARAANNASKVARVDATMNQLTVLSEIIKVLAPIKSAIDHARDTQQRFAAAAQPAKQTVGV